MKELFNDRLKKMDNLEDRKWMKEIINSVFLKLTEHTQEELEKLEQRVFEEVEDMDTQFSTYSKLIPLEEYDPLDEMFFPMDKNDLHQEQIDFAEILSGMRANEQPVVTKVYLPLDYLEIRKKLEEWQEKRFQGTLVTTSAAYPITFKAEPYDGYLERIEELYHLYIKNDIAWRTVLQPYSNKFIQLRLADYPELKEREQIVEINFQLEKLEEYQNDYQIPCWNVEEIVVSNSGFPNAAKDRAIYEHTINLDKYGREHGYLIRYDAEHLKYTRRTKAALSVISSKERVVSWPMLKIAHLHQQESKEQVLGNHRSEMFTDRFARKENQTIRSMCEISRIINTYPAAKELTLERVEMIEQGEEVEETYPMNPFLKDDIRQEEDKKVMQLYFKTSSFSEITRDKMSFLVSELQLHFPEFKCAGALL